MCDDDTSRDDAAFLQAAGARAGLPLTRRRLGALGAGAAALAMLPRLANALDVVASDIEVTTPDGVADCHFVHPAAGKHAAVLVWPDIFGLRPAFRAMARRLAESGYAVLVVNPYYRTERAPILPEGASFQDPAVREKLFPLARSLTPDIQQRDARAFVGWLDQQAAVDTARKVGTTGYCMGGPIVMRTAAALPDRIGAGASFHGGGLATDQPDSPHRLVPQMRAQFLVAIASNDDEKEPQAKDLLREAFAAAGLKAEIEVYPALHGWCPPDSQVHDPVQADRAWARLLALFEAALA